MENIFLTSCLVSFVYFVFKLIELKYMKCDDNKPFKEMVKDTLIVYLSSVVGYLLLGQILLVLTDEIKGTQVFTGTPDF